MTTSSNPPGRHHRGDTSQAEQEDRSGDLAARRLSHLAQQPKARRTLQKEIADYQANAEARAFAAEQAAAEAAALTATKQPT